MTVPANREGRPWSDRGFGLTGLESAADTLREDSKRVEDTMFGKKQGSKGTDRSNNRLNWAQSTGPGGKPIFNFKTSFADPTADLGASRYERLRGILFARPESDTTLSQILPHLTYFHIESGDRFDFLCVGYFSANASTPIVAHVDGKDWAFSDRAFVEVKDELEK